MMKEADADKGKFLGHFFKTGKGQYGEGDKFLGITVPVTRALAKQYSEASLEDVAVLIKNSYHEIRLLGLLILVSKYEKAKADNERKALVTFYHANRKGINNWDLVDLSVYKIWGDYLRRHPEKRSELYKYSRSKNLWDRRLAVVSTIALIKNGEFEEIIELAKMLLNDKEDLMHKAVGWMLREMGKKDEKVLRHFLDEYATRLPRTALRYAIERLPEKERLRYLRM
ncbi:DNA alkylation repair protein [Candidatus Falkowbacteria bacterium HGW-Falkowbacteria-2]|uniref:DNA alkylation repair protein n=1 Tax=Candidatus Falkowbacteria bacterium HGW-Falkowbacteria-2 TaxID=2013769 RepID=A0A2N2E3Z7_9BACT|nr:MAG: DNA alkylation repair protein [Candidatus Falkowbacteria bacterium HGW-Falkowbacteria-2]